MNRTYTPQEGSVAWKVIEYLTTNPGEVLTLAELEAKYEKAASQFHSLLGAAVEAGVLVRGTKADEELTYGLGTGHKRVPANKARNPTLRPDALLAGAKLGKRMPIAPIDLGAVAIRTDVPLPEKATKKLDWTKLFTRMEVGHSCVLPITLRGSLTKACKEAKAAGAGEFTVRPDTDETLAIWRTA